MLEGFEQETAPLNEWEQGLLPGFISGLKTKIGKENAITNKAIVQSYKDRGIELSDTRVRKIINYIRMHGLVQGLIATSKGYYISKDPAEVLAWVKSLHGREAAIAAIRSNVLTYLSQLITPQPRENGRA